MQATNFGLESAWAREGFLVDKVSQTRAWQQFGRPQCPQFVSGLRKKVRSDRLMDKCRTLLDDKTHSDRAVRTVASDLRVDGGDALTPSVMFFYALWKIKKCFTFWLRGSIIMRIDPIRPKPVSHV